MWQEIISIIENNHSFVITAHTNPDCDALGSELALAEHLRRLGKQVIILNSDATPQAFQFLDQQPKHSIKRYSQAKHQTLIKNINVIFVLDASGGWERVGRVGEACQQSTARKVCIDHHPDPTDFVDTAVVDTEAAATAELIFDLIQAMDGAVSYSMAQALYAAIITDTGNFRFPKTNPRTHHVAAKLLSAGIDPMFIYRQLYEQYPLERVRLRGHVLESIQTTSKGRIAFYGLNRATLKAYGVKGSALDGFASLGQEVGGVKATVFCLETSSGQVKISLRSDGSVAVNRIATEYGGGGHFSAAGATVNGQLAEVLAEVVAKMEQELVAAG